MSWGGGYCATVRVITQRVGYNKEAECPINTRGEGSL